jgi:hypothetical protein
MLSKLEQQLVRDLGEVRNGISVLQVSDAPSASPSLSQPVYLPRPVENEMVDVDADDNQQGYAN